MMVNLASDWGMKQVSGLAFRGTVDCSTVHVYFGSLFLSTVYCITATGLDCCCSNVVWFSDFYYGLLHTSYWIVNLLLRCTKLSVF
jgi:hypothetical protein